MKTIALILFLFPAIPVLAQAPAAAAASVMGVPRLVRFTSSFRPSNGSGPSDFESATWAIYASETGGTALWQETQNVPVDSEGHYSVLLGSTRNEGLPVELFASGESRWLGVLFHRAGEVEQKRVLMATVPYALKAIDADTLGGQPASAYLLAPSESPSGTTASATDRSGPARLAPKVASGTTNNIAKFVNGTDLGNSVMAESNGKIGIGTSTPAAALDIVTTGGGAQFTNTQANSFAFNTFSSPGNASYIYDFGNLFASSGRYVQSSFLFDAGNILSLSAASQLRFYTNGDNERMRIDSTGVSLNTSVTACCTGISGTSTVDSGTGVFGEAENGPNAWGVWGRNVMSGLLGLGQSGHFQGNVQVTGMLTKGAGAFKIDHPLDPANKYLYHSFVESPDMMNVYNGNIVTGDDGRATVALPDYFETLNRDFRYQLTVIGQFAQVIVEQEVQNNSFAIRSDKPNVKVSWQVTGIRQDALANAHRIPVEEDKQAVERGSYIHPELYGMPEERSVDWATHPEEMKRIKARRPAGQNSPDR